MIKHKFDEGQTLYGVNGEATADERFKILSDLETEYTEQLRIERNKRLAETDWVISRAMELDEEVPDEYKVYRQRLRDTPKHFVNLRAVEWPELGQELWPTPPG